LRFDFVPARKHSTLGGLPALEALAQQLGLWQKLRAVAGLDPRTLTTHGSTPVLIVARFLSGFCTGGASLAEQRLQQRRLSAGYRSSQVHPLECEPQPMDHRARTHRRRPAATARG
jgi:hypothetical protein